MSVQWARGSQFNWVYDAMGGCPLMEAVAGVWSGFTTAVAADGTVAVRTPLPGGGQVSYLRGVWLADTTFPWNGFWGKPESGDLTNYYTGGSYVNAGTITTITLGTPLPVGTEVQIYYIYLTGATSAKNDPLNMYPCPRPAWRNRSDYTYDFAVDRIFDLMAALHFAGAERGRDYRELIDFLWQAYYPYAGSQTSPLVFDTFERSLWDRGSYLLYANSVDGRGGLGKFAIEIPSETTEAKAAAGPRALRFVPAYYRGPAFSAWFGYGFNWDLTQQYFSDISKVRFKLQGKGRVSRVQRFIKTAGTGTSDPVLIDGFSLAEVRYYEITVTKAGAPGTAEATLKVYENDLQVLNEVTIVCPSSTSPVNLGDGLQAYWQDGTLAVGDVWMITCGNQEVKPHRLQVILNDSIPGDTDPFGETHTFVHAIPDYWTSWKEFEIDFSQFWRMGNIIDCRDRRPGRWGNWSEHNLYVGKPYEMLFYDIESEETISGEVFHTQQRFTWNLDPETTVALGFYVGIPSDVNSTGKTTINYLIKHYLPTSKTFRTKVRDANGRYFYHDDLVEPNVWVRVSANLSSFLPEGGGTLTHPLTLVDIGIPSLPPAQGSFDLCDLKFDNHLTFAGSSNLRVVEFKYAEGSVELSGGPDWYLDDFGIDLSVDDAYPYVPRLAISLNAYGRNPWRGPTLVHYSHPLAPYLVNRFDIKNTELALHIDAQTAFKSWYGGLPGPIVPVHTRNDIENIALCGEENFNRFCWWSRYRDYGKEVASWRFNESLTDKAGTHTLTMTSGSPVWATGICQPGNTALSFNGTSKHAYCSGTDFHLGNADFIIETLLKFNDTNACGIIGKWNQTGNQRSWLLYRNSSQYICLGYSLDGSTSTYFSSNVMITDNNWHHILVTRNNGILDFYIDGDKYGNLTANYTFFQASAELRIGSAQGSWPGYLNGSVDYVSISIGRGVGQEEAADRWQIAQGLANGSDYPEVGHALGQYWAFYRLGEYYFVSNDAGAWDVLNNWLGWFSTYLVADGSGWKFPVWFSEYGFTYGAYDPGAAASIAIGALYIYMRNGDARALTLAQRILGDLRNRASGDYGGYLYKSDYHYAWMNALVAHAFGMAVVGRAGAAYRYPYEAADEVHYQNIMANFWAMSGDTKPNLLNADLIPFTYVEAADVWDYAPHYLFMRQCGSTEGLVLMMEVAIDWAKRSGSWVWFDTLLAYLLRESLAVLAASSLRRVNSSYDLTNLRNKISVFYGDYNRNNTLYHEVKNQALIDALGELPKTIDLQYGSAVITENPEMAATLADRLLQRLSAPRETVEIDAWLEAARIDLNDTVAISSDFHGFDRTEFTCFGRRTDFARGKVSLVLSRRIDYPQFWAVEDVGTDYDSYAIDADTPVDPNWSSRGYVQ